ncbi:MAG TPA: hypothetical protein VHS30_05805 [Streptosporangiaceae bacterium]|nr:hypothetical protein [Streptosporangiaceae bacterium]
MEVLVAACWQLASGNPRQRAQGSGQFGVRGEYLADVGIGVGDQGEVAGRVRRDLLPLQARRRWPAGAGPCGISRLGIGTAIASGAGSGATA